MIQHGKNGVRGFDPCSARFWTGPFNVLVRPGPDVEVGIDVVLILVHHELEGCGRRSVEGLEVLGYICADGVFLRVRGKGREGFARTSRGAENIRIRRYICSCGRWGSLPGRLGLYISMRLLAKHIYGCVDLPPRLFRLYTTYAVLPVRRTRYTSVLAAV